MDSEFLIIYRSSAGSGKTYTLTREYLRLALGGVNEHIYRKILAVTFTNKAMQEMKDRIVFQLNEFSTGRPGSMGEELRNDLGLTAEEFTENSSNLLAEILHDYSHFSITTIDAFFQRVIRSFARELGLAGSYRLELEPELSIHEIIQDLMSEVEEDKVLRDWLVEYSIERLEQGSSWMVERDLEEFTKKLLSEDFQRHEEVIRKMGRSEIMKYGQDLKKEYGIIRNHLKKKAREGMAILDRYGVMPEELFYGRNGLGNYLNKVLNEDFEPGGHVRKALDQGKMTSSKAGPNTEAALADGLEKIFYEIDDYWTRHREAFNTAKAIIQNIYLLGLTQDILTKMNDFKREQDLMFIADSTRLLTNLVHETDAMFIYERVGSFFDHFLIDEFQDTSGYQWKSFSPLIDNSMSEGNINLIVGDVKQSIYRWRGGELELLQEKVEAQFGARRIRKEQLRSNFRSTPAVIGFNNALFESLPHFFGEVFGDSDSPATEEAEAYFRAIYHDVAQDYPLQIKEEQEKGYVQVQFLKDDDQPWKEQALDQMILTIEELQDKNVPLKDIAILVNRNREGQLAAQALAEKSREHTDSRYSYRFISNDSLYLSGSPACRILIAALRYLTQPQDSLNRAELAFYYQLIHKDGTALQEVILDCGVKEDVRRTEPELLIAQISAWTKRPFIELIEKLIHVLRLNKLSDEFAYLQTFQDLVLRFVSRERGDFSGFISWWDNHASKETIKVPDDLDAIRIMTIHKSKGLEFHSVIVPFLNWKIDHQLNPVIWLEAEDQVVPVKYKKDLDESAFATPYREERKKAFVDNLNKLYVAFTRASHDLWVTGPGGGSSNVDTAVEKAVKDISLPGSNWDTGQKIFTIGSRDFVFESVNQKEGPAPVRLETYTESSWEEQLVLKPVTSSLIPSERQVKINTGIIIHQLLARVRYTVDFEKALNDIAWEEALSEEDVVRVKNQILKSFKNPQIRGWFSKKWEVINESAILTRQQEFRPDRVIMDENEVLVIDYKTGLRNDHDMMQVRNYVKILGEMENKPARGYLWYIDLNEIVEV